MKNNILNLFNKNKIFYLDIKKSENKSHETIKKYNQVLESFYDFIVQKYEINQDFCLYNFDKFLLSEYISTKGELSQNTLANQITIIKGFIFFMADENIEIAGNIKSSLNKFNIKIIHKTKSSFTKDEFDKLIEYIKKLEYKKDFLSQRNCLILKLLLFTGLRASELCGIKSSEIEITNNMYLIKIHGKGKKERTAQIHKELIEQNLEFTKNSTEYLIVTNRNNPLSRQILYSNMLTCLKKAGILKRGVHIFRHSFGDYLHELGYSIQTISSMLGHSNIKITYNFYFREHDQTKKEIADKIFETYIK